MESWNEKLTTAAWNGDTEALKLSLQNGADIDYQDEDGQTALMKAAWREDTWRSVVSSLIEDFIRQVLMSVVLFQRGGETALMGCQEDGETALMRAASGGHLEICKLLIDTGCKIDITDLLGWTALMFAAQEGHLEICRLLIDRGCKIDITNNSGYTALHYAAQEGHLQITRCLVEQGGASPLITTHEVIFYSI
ncbi:unnamed protein product [Mytilus edulis]|uniref:Uncharacterized protein n=1 Tax=Mytilus edulis TaxID=6550 RepID=A0A8S3SM55_MYTED|nr:unnamed protein product [Mytilus edulis]